MPKYYSDYLLKKIPSELKGHFKAYCAKRGKSMRRVMLEMMKKAVKKQRH